MGVRRVQKGMGVTVRKVLVGKATTRADGRRLAKSGLLGEKAEEGNRVDPTKQKP
jgi:hypothetical protein